ncbi:Oidioi.mRNA.OKI2018_I69.chr1.g1317.t2.cds [Oikopleura dioica]|uniref:Oidioi.mRNA.OKI2018_I69.chr1.g1317.t1.cds n=1 Tax=Oikopleura dioica TaxID=34765 RepID=A0ABN7SR32_OIKDI|nr:Oidioi.mRNA.OKI2018_I69.chr1.g1317.t1.cds [Oikopleura dioica]CAG5104540.1 Oidioi.mRNA.OKI2018_I69.chr1.g1317.t2.cds [Oikopleura dioica]
MGTMFELPFWKLQRYRIMILTIFMNITGYMIRFAIDVAILDMVDDQKRHHQNSSSCSNSSLFSPISEGQFPLGKNHSSPKYHWTEEQQSMIIEVFFYGYTLSVGIGGLFADVLGARFLVGCSVLLSGLLGIFYELFASWGFEWLCVLRFFQGLLQAGMFPPQTSMWGRWAPENERTIIVGGSNAAAIFGVSMSNILTSAICESLGWPYAFYIFGSFGVLFGSIWILYFRNTPEEMPWCQIEEKEYIKANTTASARIEIKEIPFKKIFSSFVFWVACIANLANSIIFFTITDKLPEYLQKVHHYNLLADGFLSALPFICYLVVTFVSSALLDFARSKNILSITNLRKIAAILALVPAGICFFVISPMGCDSGAIVALMCVIMGFNGFSTTSFLPSLIDMSPSYAGILHGIQDTCFSAFGFITPIFIQKCVGENPYLISSWNTVWIINGALAFVSAVFYGAFATSERQDWDLKKEEKMAKNEKEGEIKTEVMTLDQRCDEALAILDQVQGSLPVLQQVFDENKLLRLQLKEKQAEIERLRGKIRRLENAQISISDDSE